MAQTTFRFAAFNSGILENQSPSGSSLTLSVDRPAPDEATRPSLKTRVFKRPDEPHDAFRAFSVLHDHLVYFDAYPNAVSDDADEADDFHVGVQSDNTETADPSETVRQNYIGPIRFLIYELAGQPGFVYATTPASNLKELFRRYRTTTNKQGEVFQQRVVDVRALEASLKAQAGSETTGYNFSNVQSTTAIARLATDGQQLDDNDDVQNIRERAERILALRFDLERNGTILKMGIDEHGTVKFSSYPGDHSGLGILYELEGYIASHSDLVAVTVR